MTEAARRAGRRAQQYSQAERLSRMMRTLSSRAVTVTDLAQEFGISGRQAYRDLARIEEEGHPLTQNDELGERTWQLPLGYQGLHPITLSPYELMSLSLAKSHLAYLEGTPFFDDLQSLIAKVQAGLPAKTLNHLERIVQAFLPWQRPMRGYGTQKDVVANLRKALLLQRRIELDYRKPGAGKSATYDVDPYVLILYQAGLYLVGYSHRSRAERTFAVERVRRVRVSEHSFMIPPSFSAADRLHRLFGLMNQPPQEVRIRFSADVAYLFKERRWHPTQRVKPLKNGGVLVTFQTGGLEELASWVLSWGPQAKVLAPSALRKLVAAESKATAKQYQFSSSL